MFQLPALCPPTQYQMLNRTHVGGRGYGPCDPTVIRTQGEPVAGWNLAGKGIWATTSTAFRQHLPLLLQHVIDVVVATKAGVRAQDGALFLCLTEAQELIHGSEHG